MNSELFVHQLIANLLAGDSNQTSVFERAWQELPPEERLQFARKIREEAERQLPEIVRGALWKSHARSALRAELNVIVREVVRNPAVREELEREVKKIVSEEATRLSTFVSDELERFKVKMVRALARAWGETSDD